MSRNQIYAPSKIDQGVAALVNSLDLEEATVSDIVDADFAMVASKETIIFGKVFTDWGSSNGRSYENYMIGLSEMLITVYASVEKFSSDRTIQSHLPADARIFVRYPWQ